MTDYTGAALSSASTQTIFPIDVTPPTVLNNGPAITARAGDSDGDVADERGCDRRSCLGFRDEHEQPDSGRRRLRDEPHCHSDGSRPEHDVLGHRVWPRCGGEHLQHGAQDLYDHAVTLTTRTRTMIHGEAMKRLTACGIFAALLWAAPTQASPIFTLLPGAGSDVASPGDTVGWGYEIVNDDPSDWLVVSSFNSDGFQYGTVSDIFDYPILASDTTVTVPYAPGLQGLAEFTWDATAPAGFTNSGVFTIECRRLQRRPICRRRFSCRRSTSRPPTASRRPQRRRCPSHRRCCSSALVSPVSLLSDSAGLRAPERRRATAGVNNRQVPRPWRLAPFL